MSATNLLAATDGAKPETIVGEAIPFAPESALIGGGFHESFDPHAFDQQARDWRGAAVRFLLQHEGTLFAASTASGTLAITSDGQALRFAVSLPRSLPYVSEMVARRDLAQVSIGFKALEQRWGIADDGLPTRYVVAARLAEISLVPTGLAAYPQTWAATRAQARSRIDGLRGLLAEQQRAGKVLSAASLELVHGAIAHLHELLKSAGEINPGEDADEEVSPPGTDSSSGGHLATPNDGAGGLADGPKLGPTHKEVDDPHFADAIPGRAALTAAEVRERLIALEQDDVRRRLMDITLYRRHPGGARP